MSRFVTSSIAALVLTAVMATSATAGLFHHKRSCEPSCAAEPTCCAVEPSCCAPAEPTCCAAEPVCAAEPTCCAAEPTCCAAASCCPTNPCITYHHRCGHHRNRGCCEKATYETVLHVTSPETCCTVCVPVCLPCCCEGCPAEKARCTLIGKGQVRYDWCCGVSVIVRFKHSGDICVTYVGA
jgi:hypothetical protein